MVSERFTFEALRAIMRRTEILEQIDHGKNKTATDAISALNFRAMAVDCCAVCSSVRALHGPCDIYLH